GYGHRDTCNNYKRVQGEAEAGAAMHHEDRADAEDGHEEGCDQVVHLVRRSGPTVGLGEELGEGRERVEAEAEGPRELERLSSGDPLVEDKGREDQTHNRRTQGDGGTFEAHRTPRTEGAAINLRAGIQPNPAESVRCPIPPTPGPVRGARRARTGAGR